MILQRSSIGLVKRLLLGGTILLFLFVFPRDIEASHCSNFSANGYFFSNFEYAEYVDGLLRLHFGVNFPYSDGRPWIADFVIFSDECGSGEVGSALEYKINLPLGVDRFSIRFTSPTHFEVWDDDNNVPVNCFKCSGIIAEFPAYYEVAFFGSIDNYSSILTSSSFRIRENAADPPVLTETLEIPDECAGKEFNSFGYFYDEYERVEYVNGFLTYHFRLKTPYNDGRTPVMLYHLYDNDCEVAESIRAPVSGGALTKYMRYYSLRFSSLTHYDIWNDETNEIETCIPCSVDIPGNLSDGSPIKYFSLFASKDISAQMHSTPFPIREEDFRGLDPVIVIPGILGSSDKNGEWIMDPIFHSYDDLLKTLEANGFTDGVDLFTMPYDWRQSNVLTALKLRDKINEVQAICECGKVDLVAHSMGGLIARQYIQSDIYEDDVDQLIFLGTPHLGAPKAYLMWEGGTVGVEFSLADLFLNIWLRHRALKEGFGGAKPSETLFNYVNNYPILSLKELLPIYSYLKNSDTGEMLSYPHEHPRNTFLEVLNTSINELTESGVKITNIFSDSQNDTISSILVKYDSGTLPLWEHGKPVELEKGDGDRTVPIVSSAIFNVNTNIDSRHNDLPSKSSGAITEILNDEVTAETIGTLLPKSILTVFLLSPIDVVVIAPDGKRIGKNFETGEEFSEIIGAFYSGFLTDNEYITIPDPADGEYIIQVQGTDEGGAYTISINYIADGILSGADYSGATASGLVQTLKIEVKESASDVIGFEVTKNDIIENIKTAFGLGWLDNSGIRESLIRQVNADSFGSLLYELDAQKEKHLNKSAYTLLKESIEWYLKNNQ